MPDKRLLYFISGQVHVFRWKRGHLASEALFRTNEQGVEEFRKYVASNAHGLYFILADVVEEDFFHETVPYVRGRDRRELLNRKLAQRYRDLSLALALSLGYESRTRREEKILFSSFTNTQQFQPWLAALREHRVRLAGVYSLPLVSPLVGRRIGVTGERYLLVSLQEGGLRQSFIENGRIRFSRLGQTDRSDPAKVAHAAAMESGRIQQYLLNMRLLPRTAGPLDVVVLAPADELEVFRAACANTSHLSFHVVDLDAACRKAGMRSAPPGLRGERLFLQVLGGTQPVDQFADNIERRFYLLRKTQLAAVAAGAAVFLLCAMLSGFRLMDIAAIQQLAAADRALEAQLAEQYARLQAQFPRTPASAENLKALVRNYEIIQKQTASLNAMLAEVSQAVTASPQLDIDRIDWRLAADPRKAAAAAKASKGAPSSQSAEKAEKAGAEINFQVIEISGRVNVAQASDYRNIIVLVNQFVEALRKRPGLEVFSAQLPFDLNAEKSLSGDIGVQRPAEIPRFTIVAARRLGA